MTHKVPELNRAYFWKCNVPTTQAYSYFTVRVQKVLQNKNDPHTKFVDLRLAPSSWGRWFSGEEGRAPTLPRKRSSPGGSCVETARIQPFASACLDGQWCKWSGSPGPASVCTQNTIIYSLSDPIMLGEKQLGTDSRIIMAPGPPTTDCIWQSSKFAQGQSGKQPKIVHL